MKLKFLASLSVLAIAFALFFNSNSISNSDLNLASLIALNTANAESNCDGWWDCTDFNARLSTAPVYSHTANGSVSITLDGTPLSITLASGQINSGFVGMYGQCTDNWFDTCDKRDQGWQ